MGQERRSFGNTGEVSINGRMNAGSICNVTRFDNLAECIRFRRGVAEPKNRGRLVFIFVSYGNGNQLDNAGGL